VVQEVMDSFENNEYDEVVLIYNHSKMQRFRFLLPISSALKKQKKKTRILLLTTLISFMSHRRNFDERAHS